MQRSIVSVLFMVLLGTQLPAQTTLNVPSTSYPTIQSAIDAAVNGDIVQIAAGHYYEAPRIHDKDITLKGAGIDETTLHWTPGNDFGFVFCSANGPSIDLTVEGMAFDGDMQGLAGQCAFFLVGSLTTTGSLVLKSVRFAGWRGGFTCFFAELEMEDCHFGNCYFDAATSPGIGGAFSGPFSFVSAKRTRFWNNINVPDLNNIWEVNSGDLFAGTIGGAIFEDCRFEGHRGGQLFAAYGGTVERCLFEDCIHVRTAVTVDVNNNCALIECSSMIDCLIVDSETEVGTIVDLRGSATLRRCTIANNRARNNQQCVIRHLGSSNSSTFESLIVSGNDNNVVDLRFNTTTMTYGFIDCLIEGGWTTLPVYQPTGYGAFVPPVVTETNLFRGLEAGFRDPDNGDFSLLPGSPAVNAAISGSGLPSDDLNGDPRVVGAAADMGCFELQNLDPGSAFDGTVPAGDILLFNGSSGGVARNIAIPAGSACTLTVAAPGQSATAPFVLWGFLGVPRAFDEFSIPFAGGSMAFTPHLVGGGDPRLFTFSNNLIGSTPGLLASTPAPFSVGGPSIGFPITMTIQGLIAVDSGPLCITNAITLHTY